MPVGRREMAAWRNEDDGIGGVGPRAKRDKIRMVADDIVTANSLATHLGCTRQNIARLTAEAVIEQRSDGHYDQTASRLRYIEHLRTPRSSRAEADAAHVKVKTEMLQLRMMKRQRKLVRREDANALIDEICGVVLTHLSGMGCEVQSGHGGPARISTPWSIKSAPSWRKPAQGWPTSAASRRLINRTDDIAKV